MTDRDLFTRALAARGEAFLAVVEEAAAGGPEVVPRLAQVAQEAEGFHRLLAELLLRSAEDDASGRNEVLDFMRRTEEEMALQVNDQPSPQWGAGRLLELFGEEVAPFLAVYAAKLDGVWRYWRVASSILYLRHVANEAAFAGLARLVASTPLEPFRDLATEALVEAGDPRALAFVEAELAGAEDREEGDSEGARALRRVADALGGLA